MSSPRHAGDSAKPAAPVPPLDQVTAARANNKTALQQANRREARSTPRSSYAGLSHDLLAVNSVPLLTREDEVRLAAAIKRGDEQAREQMIRANLRLVVKIAREYEHLGLPVADLVSEGIIGLTKAVDRFQPSKGGKLSTYGSWWIRQQIRRALANQGRTIRLPVHVESKLYRLSRVEARLRNELDREPTDDELSAELNMPAKKIEQLRDASIRASSLDTPVGSDDITTVGELVADEYSVSPADELQRKVDHAKLRRLLRRLPEREARILHLRFGLNGGDELTLEDVGREFNLTRERIRQLQNEAFAKLKAMMDAPEPLPVAA
jgi:RNA polymerase primary sigma factor